MITSAVLPYGVQKRALLKQVIPTPRHFLHNGGASGKQKDMATLIYICNQLSTASYQCNDDPTLRCVKRTKHLGSPAGSAFQTGLFLAIPALPAELGDLLHLAILRHLKTLSAADVSDQQLTTAHQH